MVDFLERHKRIFLLSGIVLCVVAIIVTVNPYVGSTVFGNVLSRVITPMQRGLSATISWVGGGFSSLGNNRRLLEENRRLEALNNMLLMENQRLQFAEEENYRLSALLDINQRYGELPTMGARIIGISPNVWHSRFFVDRGENDGITNNMAVLGGGGLIGVIRQVHPTRSQFVSIIDSSFSVAVMNPRTGDVGMAGGDTRLMQQGHIRMDRIEPTSQIIAGDELFTSPHSSIFPPGILVGTVVSIHPNPDGHTRYAIIRPAASLDDIEIVSIVTQVFGDINATEDGHAFIVED